MNDGKYKVALIDTITGIELPLPPNAMISLVKIPTGVPIPEEEPIFIFRARDWNALKGIQAYREICIADGCNDHQMRMADEAIQRFSKFAEEHPDQMKQPGVTRGL
jgi:hypothetical protein